MNDIPEPDEDWLESLSCTDASDAIYDLSPAVLQYFYPGISPLQLQPLGELPCSNTTVDRHRSCSSDAVREHRSSNGSSTCSNLTDSASRDENAPGHLPLKGGGGRDVSNPFQTVSGRSAPSVRQVSPLQSLQSTTTQAQDAAQYQPDLQQEAGDCTAIPAKRLHGCVAGGPGTADIMQSVTTLHVDGHVPDSGAPGPAVYPESFSCSPEAAVITSTELGVATGSGGVADLSRADVLELIASDVIASCVEDAVAEVVGLVAAISDRAGPDAVERVGSGVVDRENKPGNVGCHPGSPTRQASCSAEDLFPEKNFEDSEEDDGGYMEQFKSCMNDHSVYDTKRSRVFEVSTSEADGQEVPPVSDISTENAAPFDVVQQGSSGHVTSTKPALSTETLPPQQAATASTAAPFPEAKSSKNVPDKVQDQSDAEASSRLEPCATSGGTPSSDESKAGPSSGTSETSDKPVDSQDVKHSNTPAAGT